MQINVLAKLLLADIYYAGGYKVERNYEEAERLYGEAKQDPQGVNMCIPLCHLASILVWKVYQAYCKDKILGTWYQRELRALETSMQAHVK
jgi:hypothetical protein